MKITDEMKIQICRDDFYETLKQAINSAGGSLTQDEIDKMPFKKFVEMMAQNGLRVEHRAERHMNSIKLNWDALPAQPDNWQRHVILGNGPSHPL
jgi:hypothetical protein